MKTLIINLVCFSMLFLGIGFLQSQISGWARLAKCYRSISKLRTVNLLSQTARIGRFGFYNNCLNIGFGADGLHLGIWKPLSAWHHRLIIPWDDLTIHILTGPIGEYGELLFQKVPSVSMRVSKALCKTISERSNIKLTKVHVPRGRTGFGRTFHAGWLGKALLVLFTGCLFSFGLFLWIASDQHLSGLYRIAHRPAFADGVVSGKKPENHNQVNYTFYANNRRYDGEGRLGDAFYSTKIGDTVRVTYDPEDPSVSMLIGNASNDLKGISLIGGIFSLLGGFGFAISLLKLGLFKQRHKYHR